MAGGAGNSLITRPSDNVVFYNPTYSDMTRPVQGPVNPWNDRKLEKMNTITGEASTPTPPRRSRRFLVAREHAS